MSQENNFVPEQENYKPLSPFQLFVKSNFPFIEATFEALDNYGLYCKIVEYLNDVIANENSVEENVTALYNAFVSLNSYVSNYFDNLDVQEEINNKLDSMVESGELQSLLTEQYTELRNEVNEQIETIDNKVTSAVSGSPAGVYASVASLKSENPDHSKIYLVTADGKWYYYSTSDSDWVAGGTYQSTGLDPNNTQLSGINAKSNILPYNYGFNEASLPENMEQGNITSVVSSALVFSNSTARVRTEENNPMTQGTYHIYVTNSAYSFYGIVANSEGVCLSNSNGWVTSYKLTVGENQKGYLLIKKSDNSSIAPTEAISNVRILSGSITYNIPKIITRYPIEIDTLNHTITFKSGTIINTPFLGNMALSSDRVLSYTTNTNNLLYKIVYDTTNKLIKIETYNATISYNYIILGYIWISKGRVNDIQINAPYIINGDVRYPHATYFKNGNYEISNITLDANGINLNNNSEIRVATTKYIKFNGKINIINKNNTTFRFAYRLYSKNNDVYTQLYDSGWITSETFLLDVSTNYTALIFSRADGTALSAQDIINNFDIQTVYNIESYSSLKPRLDNFHSVGHQGCIDSAHRGNSRSAFIYASINGRTDIECDLKVTSDNVIVLNHDETITDDENETITISEVTYDELLTHLFNGETIATFEEFLQICKKYGTNAYIDHMQYVLSNSTAKAEMIRLIRNYRMEKRITFLTGTTNWSDLLSYFPYARMLYVKISGELNSTDIANVLSFKTNLNEVGFDLNYSNYYNTTVLELFDNYSDILLEYWTINNIDTYKEILPYANGITSNTYTGYDCIS